MKSTPPAAAPRFCSDCGAKLNEGARFCHICGASLYGRAAAGPSARAAAPAAASPARRWLVPLLALAGVVVLSVVQLASRDAQPADVAGTPLGGSMGRAPDISSMSPEERADRLFNRVMLASIEGKTDSVAFFAPMAIGAIEALAPLDAHRRYDLGLIALATGDATRAAAQADTMLAARATHLLGLVLAARAADARGDRSGAADFRRRLLAAEPAERARALPEYTDHDADLREGLAASRAP
jgi:hypothetical protein